MEKWPSGRWQRFRKPSWVKAHREFESLLLRKYLGKMAEWLKASAC